MTKQVCYCYYCCYCCFEANRKNSLCTSFEIFNTFTYPTITMETIQHQHTSLISHTVGWCMLCFERHSISHSIQTIPFSSPFDLLKIQCDPLFLLYAKVWSPSCHAKVDGPSNLCLFALNYIFEFYLRR